MGTSVFILVLSCGLTAIFAGPPVNNNYEDNDVSRSTEADSADWVLVADKMECGGSEETTGYFSSLEECAGSCQKISSMFIFGTNDYGTDRCQNGTCRCFCETAATADGICSQINHNGFRLYKYQSTGATLTCTSWPSSIVIDDQITDAYGCSSSNNGVWTMLSETTVGTAECESLCREFASDDGCCFVKDSKGCWWKNAETAGVTLGFGKAITCTSNSAFGKSSTTKAT